MKTVLISGGSVGIREPGDPIEKIVADNFDPDVGPVEYIEERARVLATIELAEMRDKAAFDAKVEEKRVEVKNKMLLPSVSTVPVDVKKVEK